MKILVACDRWAVASEDGIYIADTIHHSDQGSFLALADKLGSLYFAVAGEGVQICSLYQFRSRLAGFMRIENSSFAWAVLPGQCGQGVSIIYCTVMADQDESVEYRWPTNLLPSDHIPQLSKIKLKYVGSCAASSGGHLLIYDSYSSLVDLRGDDSLASAVICESESVHFFAGYFDHSSGVRVYTLHLQSVQPADCECLIQLPNIESA